MVGGAIFTAGRAGLVEVTLLGGGVLCGAGAEDWLFVVSGDEDGCVVCCAIALNVISKEAVGIHFQVRITEILSVLLLYALGPPSSVGQLENHMYGGGGIYGLIVVLRRLKAHLICGFNGSFVQAVSHSAYDAIHVQLSVGPKHDFQ